MKYITILLSLLIVGFPALADENNDQKYIDFFNKTVTKLLPGFRYPTDADMKFAWKMKGSFVYKTEDDERKHKAPFWTKGLFNDDDIIDYVFDLVNTKEKKKYLYAFISSPKGYIPVLLQEAHDDELGLATQQAAKIQTASGKGYWKPTKDDPPEITVDRQAIAYFEFEGASSVFLWDRETKHFTRHWISD